MKRTFILILIGICFNISIFANNYSDNSYYKTQMLIEDNLQKNLLAIKNISTDLSDKQKIQLIQEYKQDCTLPLVLNIFLPFGIGSFYQGDTAGGFIGLTGDLTTLTLYTIGTIKYFTSLTDIDTYEETPDISDIMSDSLIYIVSSGIIGVATVVFKILRPINYTKNYNNDLINVLNCGDNYSMKVIPGIDLTSANEIVPSVSVKISY